MWAADECKGSSEKPLSISLFDFFFFKYACDYIYSILYKTYVSLWGLTKEKHLRLVGPKKIIPGHFRTNHIDVKFVKKCLWSFTIQALEGVLRFCRLKTAYKQHDKSGKVKTTLPCLSEWSSEIKIKCK